MLSPVQILAAGPPLEGLHLFLGREAWVLQASTRVLVVHCDEQGRHSLPDLEE